MNSAEGSTPIILVPHQQICKLCKLKWRDRVLPLAEKKTCTLQILGKAPRLTGPGLFLQEMLPAHGCQRTPIHIADRLPNRNIAVGYALVLIPGSAHTVRSRNCMSMSTDLTGRKRTSSGTTQNIIRDVQNAVCNTLYIRCRKKAI